jgi:hypothetical protein
MVIGVTLTVGGYTNKPENEFAGVDAIYLPKLYHPIPTAHLESGKNMLKYLDNSIIFCIFEYKVRIYENSKISFRN